MSGDSYAETRARSRERLAEASSSASYIELQHLAAALERVCDLYTARYLREGGADAYVRDRMNACVLEFTCVHARLRELRAGATATGVSDVTDILRRADGEAR